ncbi:hypothetical protein B566_EDAN002614 [Ephemera danica]|nr:hypothetical protein B566_EDAN002614 [Ephemera danica]
MINSLVGLLVLLAVSSTLYDLLAPVDETSKSDLCMWRRIFLAFAARKHFLGLGKMESAGEQDLNFLFGLRLASILLVIFCHKAGFSTAGPNMSPGFQEMTFSQLRFMPLLHADLVVDTFFFLAGFLLTVGLLKALRRPETHLASTIWPLYIFRYMRACRQEAGERPNCSSFRSSSSSPSFPPQPQREGELVQLTPAYLLTVFFYATLLPRMGSGPLWKVTVLPEHEYCIKNWWLNALYINNYINVDKMI